MTTIVNTFGKENLRRIFITLTVLSVFFVVGLVNGFVIP